MGALGDGALGFCFRVCLFDKENLPSPGSLPPWLQQPRLGRVRAKNLKRSSGVPREWQKTITCCLPEQSSQDWNECAST